MKIKLILIFISLVVLGCYFYFEKSDDDAFKNSLQIKRINKIESPVEQGGGANKSYLSELDNPTSMPKDLEIKDEMLANDPYEELRRKGSSQVKNDTSIYVESTVKLEGHLKEENIRDLKPQSDPYSELKENNSTVGGRDTSEYFNSVISLEPNPK